MVYIELRVTQRVEVGLIEHEIVHSRTECFDRCECGFVHMQSHNVSWPGSGMLFHKDPAQTVKFLVKCHGYHKELALSVF